MTAEIAILNRAGVALAADSAVTISGDRVWKSANKLFQLSSDNDIGIMVFGNGDFLEIPWEIVIKQYRKKIGTSKFNSITECSNDFVDFINNFDPGIPEVEFVTVYLVLLEVMFQSLSEVSGTKTEIKKRFSESLDQIIHQAGNLESIEIDISEAQLRKQYEAEISEIVVEIIDGKFFLPNTLLRKVIAACFARLSKAYATQFSSGVVIAGFGDGQLLPSLVELRVDGRLGPRARAWVRSSCDLSDVEQGSAYVMPFAQSDIATLFVEGLHPQFNDYVASVMLHVLNRRSDRLVKAYVNPADAKEQMEAQRVENRAQAQAFMAQFRDFRQESVVDPMMRVINSLPKEEMASMAEALVDITSLRRKVDSDLETVGGPVDVAIISKADGFVWIKRKHYFDIALNPDFLQRRDRKNSGEANG